MKITIVNNLYAPNHVGGAEISVQALAENFVAKGNDVLVICLGKKTENYVLNGVKVEVLKIKNNYWPFDNQNKTSLQKITWHLKDAINTNYNNIFKELLLGFKTDILLTNNLSGFSTKIWQIGNDLNIKSIHVLRDYYLQCPKSTKFKNLKNCDKLCPDCKMLSIPKKKDSVNIDYVIGISNYILKDHLKNGYFKNVPNKVIYNGFKIDGKSNTVNNDKIVFGYIGQVNKSKGIELLLQSFLKVKSTNWQLIIAGKIDKEYLNYLKGINNSDQIKFL